MKICGLQKTTLLDFPGHVAATIFTGGCNFRCPFCHNSDLLGSDAPAAFTDEEVLDFLKKRRGILEGAAITGGEPTLQPDLEDFIQKVRALGYQIKLDTNGYMPGVLWELLQEHLIDYVAMDIKASRDNYARAAGLPHMDISRIEESIGILKSSGIPYEFRTTVVRGIHTVVEFEKIGKWIAGCPAYYLQNYEENENCLYRMIQTVECDDVKPGGVDPFGAFSREELEQMEELVRKYVGKVILRGVE